MRRGVAHRGDIPSLVWLVRGIVSFAMEFSLESKLSHLWPNCEAIVET